MVTSATPTQNRGCKYTTEEEETVARAYMTVFIDPIFWIQSEEGTLYERI